MELIAKGLHRSDKAVAEYSVVDKVWKVYELKPNKDKWNSLKETYVKVGEFDSEEEALKAAEGIK